MVKPGDVYVHPLAGTVKVVEINDQGVLVEWRWGQREQVEADDFILFAGRSRRVPVKREVEETSWSSST